MHHRCPIKVHGLFGVNSLEPHPLGGAVQLGTKRRAVGYRDNGVFLAVRPSPRVGLEVGEVAEVEWGHRLSESLVSLVRPGRPHPNLEASPAMVVLSPRLGTLWWPGSLFQPAPSCDRGSAVSPHLHCLSPIRSGVASPFRGAPGRTQVRGVGAARVCRDALSAARYLEAYGNCVTDGSTAAA